MADRFDRPPSFMSVATLARELDVSETTVHEMVRRGVLPQPLRLSSGCVRWNWTDVQVALNSLAPVAGGAAIDPFMLGVKNAAQT
ncbi:helix-turn-helix transcriptional regulator [Oryzibacter oryziterrae]|uniref:helix-turn-helix transcriptional regulator n=1 Tax=Oryzibacter oryziterrae TaxID=2766474 RepID=UPI001F1C4434|nr:helix-turn-helix domain-containing protein [Oryzibacter oryziterrae]